MTVKAPSDGFIYAVVGHPLKFWKKSFVTKTYEKLVLFCEVCEFFRNFSIPSNFGFGVLGGVHIICYQNFRN